MLYLSSLDDAAKVCKALSADMRIEILRLLYEKPEQSMNDLATMLHLTNSAITMHVSKLEEAGLVKIRTVAGKRGTMKLVSPCHERLIMDLAGEHIGAHSYQDDIKIGYFTACNVTPSCGMAAPSKIIGVVDDSSSFTFPEHFKADILWFTSGYVEYGLPNHLVSGQTLQELRISFEISSECPGYNDSYPSDIHFSINGVPLGFWVSPGDFGSRVGYLSPDWWPRTYNQYGLLKTLVINDQGTFMDNTEKLSDVSLKDLKIDVGSLITFRLSVPKDAIHCGGLTLFGEHFGDYRQPIRVQTFLI